MVPGPFFQNLSNAEARSKGGLRALERGGDLPILQLLTIQCSASNGHRWIRILPVTRMVSDGAGSSHTPIVTRGQPDCATHPHDSWPPDTCCRASPGKPRRIWALGCRYDRVLEGAARQTKDLERSGPLKIKQNDATAGEPSLFACRPARSLLVSPLLRTCL